MTDSNLTPERFEAQTVDPLLHALVLFADVQRVVQPADAATLRAAIARDALDLHQRLTPRGGIVRLTATNDDGTTSLPREIALAARAAAPQ